MARILRFGCHKNGIVFSVGEPISKEKLCKIFGESVEQNCYIFLEYSKICDFDKDDCSFTPKKEGNYVIVFQSDEQYYESFSSIPCDPQTVDGLLSDDQLVLMRRFLKKVKDQEQQTDSLISVRGGSDDFSMISKEQLVEGFALTSTKKQVLQAEKEEEGQVLEVSESTERSEQFMNSPDKNKLETKQNKRESFDGNSIGRSTGATTELFDSSINNSSLDLSTETTADSVVIHKNITSFRDNMGNSEAFNKIEHALKADWTVEKPTKNGSSMKATTYLTETNIQNPPSQLTTHASVSSEPENVYNVLILGETGVGKTTFVNGCANYIRYNSIEEALKDPVVLIDISFTTTTKKFAEVKVKIPATVKEGQKNTKNENAAEGQSSTQDPIIHTINWLDEGVPKQLRLIDTPGVNDTRGDKQDEDNFRKVQEFVESIGHLHAVLILLHPNVSRLTVGFRRCLDRLLSMLHTTATKNILFCFTNSRSTLYRPGDTMRVLNEFLHELEKTKGVIIKATKFNIFCFDNACFRHMYELMSRQVNNNQYCTTREDWERNKVALQSLLSQIAGMTPYSLADSTELRKIKILFNKEAKYMVELAKSLYKRKKPFEDRIIEYRTILGMLEAKKVDTTYEHKWYKPLTKMSIIEIFFWLLSFLGLTRIAKVGISLCFCYIFHHSRSQDKTVNAEASPVCKKCDCPSTSHEVVDYEFVQIEDPLVNEQLEKLDKQMETILKSISTTESEISEIDLFRTEILHCSSEFSASLGHNSIVHEKDPFLDFLHIAIREENDKVRITKNNDLLLELDRLRQNHINYVAHIAEDVQDGRRRPYNFKELTGKMEHLKSSKLYTINY